MYNLKLATRSDLPRVLELVEMAQRELKYHLPFSPERTLQTLEAVLKEGVIICSLRNDLITGIMICVKTLTAVSLTPVASELLWYIAPEYRKSRSGLELLMAFEYWAKSTGCGMICLGNMQNEYSERTSKIYLKRGYELSEQTYFKRIT